MCQSVERIVGLLLLLVKGLVLVVVILVEMMTQAGCCMGLLGLKFNEVHLLMMRIVKMVVMLKAIHLMTLMTFLLAYDLKRRLESIHH